MREGGRNVTTPNNVNSYFSLFPLLLELFGQKCHTSLLAEDCVSSEALTMCVS